MSRIFRFAHEGRELEVRVRPAEEAWELWLFEQGQPIERAATVTIDDAVMAWKTGADLIAQGAQAIEQRFKNCESTSVVNRPATAAPEKPDPADAADGALAPIPQAEAPSGAEVGRGDEGFQHALAGLSRQLGERRAHQSPEDLVAEAAKRRATYLRARRELLNKGLRVATAVVGSIAIACLLVVVSGTYTAVPTSTHSAPSSRHAETLVASVQQPPVSRTPSPSEQSEPATLGIAPRMATAVAAADGPPSAPMQTEARVHLSEPTARPSPAPPPPSEKIAPDSHTLAGREESFTSDMPPIEVHADKPALPREQVREIQWKLHVFGFSPGPIDGVMGPMTAKAILRYRQERKLSQAEEADDQLLKQLRQDPAPQIKVVQRPAKPMVTPDPVPPNRTGLLGGIQNVSNHLSHWLLSIAH